MKGNEKYELPCYNNKTIIDSIYESGIYIPSKCSVGSCGFCKSELLSGEVKIVNDKRTIMDIKYNYIDYGASVDFMPTYRFEREKAFEMSEKLSGKINDIVKSVSVMVHTD